MIACHVQNVDDDLQQDGFHAVGGRIQASIVPQLAADAKINLPLHCQAWVRGPHTGKRLPHRTDGGFHCARSDRAATGCKATVSVAVAKDLQEVDWVCHFTEEGINMQVMAEVMSDGPGVAVGGGT